VEKMIRERNVGGVLLFSHNMNNEAQTRALTGSLQELSMRTEPSIPLFIAVDHEGGEISRAPWVSPQPSAARVGARGDPDRARAIAEEIGTELLRAGVNTDLAPVVDTGFGAAIGSRSFGEDPGLVAEMGAAAVEGYEEAGVVCAAKHFPNHGAARTDSHAGLPVVNHDLAEIRSHDLPPFRAAIEAGVPMVMVGHLLYPALDPDRPASLSPEAIGVLREELDFRGVVVTDDLAMAGVSGGRPPARAAVEAVKAGASGYLLKGATVDKIVEAIKEVRAGGTVIQPNLARRLLRHFRVDPDSAPVPTEPLPAAVPQAAAAPEAVPAQAAAAQAATSSDEPLLKPLSDREREILQLIAKGVSNSEAARLLSLSKATIRTHLEHIYRKLEVTNRVEAVTEGIRKGLISV